MMDDAAIEAAREKQRAEFSREKERRAAETTAANRREELRQAFFEVKKATNTTLFQSQEGIDTEGIPGDRMDDYRDWQTKLILKAGESLRKGKWKSPLSKLLNATEDVNKVIAIKILLAAEIGNGESVRNYLVDLEPLEAGNERDMVYAWMRERVMRELIESELAAPAVPEPADEVSEIERLARETPPLNKQSGEWVDANEAARIDELKQDTLASYRTLGEKTPDRLFGIDKDKRIWRKQQSKRNNPGHPYYLVSSLKFEK